MLPGLTDSYCGCTLVPSHIGSQYGAHMNNEDCAEFSRVLPPQRQLAPGVPAYSYSHGKRNHAVIVPR